MGLEIGHGPRCHDRHDPALPGHPRLAFSCLPAERWREVAARHAYHNPRTRNPDAWLAPFLAPLCLRGLLGFGRRLNQKCGRR